MGFNKSHVAVTMRRPWLLWFVVVLPWALICALQALPQLLPLATLVQVAGIALWHWWPRRFDGYVTASASGLLVNGELVIPRAHVVAANLHRGLAGDRFVRLKSAWSLRRGQMVADVSVSSDAEADELVTAMLLDGAHAVARFIAGRPNALARVLRAAIICAIYLSLCGVLTLVATRHELIFAAAIVLAPLPFAFYGLKGILRIEVGADAMHVRPIIGRARLVGYKRIKQLVVENSNVHLKLRGDQALTISFPRRIALRRGRMGLQFSEEMHTFVMRVRERIESHNGQNMSGIAAALRRGERSAAEWRHDISSSTDGAATYRVSAIPADALLAVAVDVTAPDDARVGAIVALRRIGMDEQAHLLVRSSAEASANPALRIAMLEAVDVDQALLDDVLVSVSS